jgi:hypothetical protein
MSSLWTPGGERPVGDDGSGALGHDDPTDPTPDQEELLGELQAAREQLANTPAALVVANHAIGLFQLAAIHLDRQPPNLDDARLAIDALAAILDGLEGRLGEEEDALREARTQLQMAYVHVAGGAP